MSISNERREEIRKEYHETFPYLEGRVIVDGEEHSGIMNFAVEEFWLDILSRELEAQRKRIVGEIDGMGVFMDTDPNDVIEAVLRLPSLSRDGGEAEGNIKG